MVEYLKDAQGRPTRVVLPIEEYERLLEADDELEDIRRFDEAMAARERGEEPIPWEKVRDKIGSEYGGS